MFIAIWDYGHVTFMAVCDTRCIVDVLFFKGHCPLVAEDGPMEMYGMGAGAFCYWHPSAVLQAELSFPGWRP